MTNWTADAVRALRQRFDGGPLSQADLARAVGVSRRTVIRWEISGVPLISLLAREKLAELSVMTNREV